MKEQAKKQRGRDRRDLPHWAAVIVEYLARNNQRLEQIMAGQQEFRDMNVALRAALVKAFAEVKSDFDALKAKIDAGGTGPDLAPELAELQGTVDALNAFDPDPNNPPPAPASGR